MYASPLNLTKADSWHSTNKGSSLSDTLEVQAEEQVNDVVVCDKSTIKAVVSELETRREASLWNRRDSPAKPTRQLEEDGLPGEVLIHHNRPNFGGTIAVGRYVPALKQWQFRGETMDSTSWVMGWRHFPIPEYLEDFE
jgi:hypothetical protein